MCRRPLLFFYPYPRHDLCGALLRLNLGRECLKAKEQIDGLIWYMYKRRPSGPLVEHIQTKGKKALVG